jgi:hypothetical protein
VVVEQAPVHVSVNMLATTPDPKEKHKMRLPAKLSPSAASKEARPLYRDAVYRLPSCCCRPAPSEACRVKWHHVAGNKGIQLSVGSNHSQTVL